ncbi:MAG: SpaA isopeptide-forming pilin-related protein, partial [Acinetobacter sp.]
IVKVTFTVDAQGKISKLSKYDLATSALKPVTITDNIKAGDLGTVVNNIRYGYVNLLKVSDEQKNNDNVKLPGTKFTIYTKSDTTYTPFVSDIVVDNNGNLRCNSDGSYGTAPNNKWLVYGTYYLKETGSLSVFKPNNNYYEFTLNENNTGHLGTAWISATGSIDTKGTVSYKKANPPIPPTTIPQTDTTTFVNNTARASISIAKKDAEKANEALSGAKFIVYDKNTPVAALIENSSSGTYDELSTEKRDTPSLINWVTDKSIDNLTIPYIKDNKLLAGTYQIKEISAPTDYTDVNRIVKTVKIDNQGNLTWYDGDQVSTTSTTSNQVTNTLEKARFSITKKDSNTDELLSGVTFTLTGKDHYNQELKTENEEGIKATTDKKGVATFTNIPAGWVNEKSERQEYILTETTPTGYKTATIYKVKVDVVNHQAVVTISENKSSTSTTITNGNYAIKNTPLTGEINFVKKDANTPAGHPLAGVEFRLYKKINDVVSTTPYQTAFSNTTGQVSFKEIPYGNYVIEEIAQDGLTVASNINITKDSSTYSISNEKFTYDAGIITNTVKTGSLTLTKKDQNGNQLEGIKFKLQRRSDKTSGFVVDVPVDVNTYNDFNATEYNYNSATVYTTANNGQLALTNIPYGDYKLIEGSATANLHQGEKLAEVAFKVNKEGTTTVISGATDNTVSNTVAYGTLNITKVFDGVANNGRNRPNATFEIYSGTKATQLPYMTVKTDGTGELIRGTKPGSYGDFTNGISKDKWLLEGHYTLVEKSYDGTDQIYNVDQKQYTFDITADNQVATIGNGTDRSDKIINNVANRGTVTLTKQGNGLIGTDKTDTKLVDHLNTAEFAVCLPDTKEIVAVIKHNGTGNEYTLQSATNYSGYTQKTTNAIKVNYLNNKNQLLAGTYDLHEVVTPEGYVTPKNPMATMIIGNNTGNVTETGKEKTTVITNYIKTHAIAVKKQVELVKPTQAEFQKIHAPENSTTLAGGFTFTLVRTTEADGTVKTFDYTTTATTDKNGVANFANVPVGKYSVTETSATNQAYTINTTPQYITIKNDGTINYGVESDGADKTAMTFGNNLKRGSITGSKVDTTTKTG